jgi:hypothetical protein
MLNKQTVQLIQQEGLNKVKLFKSNIFIDDLT